MNKEKLWQIYVDKNPNFEVGPITFTAKGLRKFFDQTFDVATNNATPKPNSNIDTPDFLKDLFNGFNNSTFRGK